MDNILNTRILVLACGLLVGCTTIDPGTGDPVPDKAKTAEVKAVAKAMTKFAIREAIAQFPNDAEAIYLYMGAAGGVFCDMQRTKEFSPIALEAALSKIIIPQITNTNALRYVYAGRDGLLAIYQIAWGKRFNAELNEDEWVLVVSDILCESINTALVDSGRPPIKSLKSRRRSLGSLPATAPVGRPLMPMALRR